MKLWYLFTIIAVGGIDAAAEIPRGCASYGISRVWVISSSREPSYGRVTQITVLRSTGNELDASALSTLRQWRFRGGRVLPSIRKIDRSTREPFADRDLFIGVPVHFVLERNGVITKT